MGKAGRLRGALRRGLVPALAGVLAAAGCGLVPRTQLDECHKLSRTLQADAARLKDANLALAAQNRDYASTTPAESPPWKTRTVSTGRASWATSRNATGWSPPTTASRPTSNPPLDPGRRAGIERARGKPSPATAISAIGPEPARTPVRPRASSPGEDRRRDRAFLLWPAKRTGREDRPAPSRHARPGLIRHEFAMFAAKVHAEIPSGCRWRPAASRPRVPISHLRPARPTRALRRFGRPRRAKLDPARRRSSSSGGFEESNRANRDPQIDRFREQLQASGGGGRNGEFR